MYQNMVQRVEDVMEKGIHVDSVELDLSEEQQQIFKTWKEYSGNNHPSIIQVIWLYFLLLQRNN